MNIHVVIMAGGIGSRFWPMSTPELPKQFVDVMGRGQSMLQETAGRYSGICPRENLWVVTGRKYIDLVRQQLPDLPESNIIAEPCARSTAPCIAYACWKIMARNPDAQLVVAPSDAYVDDPEKYRSDIRQALAFASQGERIVTIGISPTRPETGYGYIAEGEAVGPDGASASPDSTSLPAECKVRKVSSFREKPDLETAKQYLKAGNYLWNAGIFVWSAQTIVRSIRTYAPDLAQKMDAMAPSFYTAAEAETVGGIFPTCENISIDYAVMEKADYIYTLPASFEWSDVGTWGSLRTLLARDENGNAVIGSNIHLYNCSGCIVHAPQAKSLVLEGLTDSIVVEREGRLLICRLSQEQKIKDFHKD